MTPQKTIKRNIENYFFFGSYWNPVLFNTKELSQGVHQKSALQTSISLVC